MRLNTAQPPVVFLLSGGKQIVISSVVFLLGCTAGTLATGTFSAIAQNTVRFLPTVSKFRCGIIGLIYDSLLEKK